MFVKYIPERALISLTLITCRADFMSCDSLVHKKQFRTQCAHRAFLQVCQNCYFFSDLSQNELSLLFIVDKEAPLGRCCQHNGELATSQAGYLSSDMPLGLNRLSYCFIRIVRETDSKADQYLLFPKRPRTMSLVALRTAEPRPFWTALSSVCFALSLLPLLMEFTTS